MSDNRTELGPDESPVRGFRPVAPSPALRARVLDAARVAWKAAPPDEVPWLWPVLRLAASIVLAALPVWMVHVMERGQAAPMDAGQGRREAVISRDVADLLDTTGGNERMRILAMVALRDGRDRGGGAASRRRELEHALRDALVNGG